MLPSNEFINELELLGSFTELNIVISKIAGVSIYLSDIISRGDTEDALGVLTGTNSDGDSQTSLDMIADKAYCEMLKKSFVKYYASEERDEVLQLNEDGILSVAIDPLDGSSNIDTNSSIGSIFSIRKFESISINKIYSKNDQFLMPGYEQIAAGYIIFGPQTILVVSTGSGVLQFVLNRLLGKFFIKKNNLIIPNDTQEYGINASNVRYWSKPMKKYIEDCNAGETGPRGSNFNMRWVASMVADVHRILSRGGIFMYPIDSKIQKQGGKLRLMYEANPMSFIVEQAGGLSSTGRERNMEVQPQKLHQRIPVIMGSKNEVERVVSYQTEADAK